MSLCVTGITCVATLFPGGSPLLEASSNPDSIVITYHSFVIEDSKSGPNGEYTAGTLCEYPQIAGLADPNKQSKLNEYLRFLVRDPSNLMESERVVSTPRDEPVGYDLVKIITADNTMLSYVKTWVHPGGAHPVTHISSMTLDIATLQPIPMDSLFKDEYRKIFELAVRGTVDSALVDPWLDAIAHQHDGRGMVVTDTAIVLGRDTEQDFHFQHAGREFSEVPVPYRMLREVIRTDGPLRNFLKEE